MKLNYIEFTNARIITRISYYLLVFSALLMFITEKSNTNLANGFKILIAISLLLRLIFSFKKQFILKDNICIENQKIQIKYKEKIIEDNHIENITIIIKGYLGAFTVLTGFTKGEKSDTGTNNKLIIVTKDGEQ